MAQTVKNLIAVRETRFNSLFSKVPWRREGLSAPVFLLGESHGQRNQAGTVHGVAKSYSIKLFVFMSSWCTKEILLFSVVCVNMHFSVCFFFFNMSLTLFCHIDVFTVCIVNTCTIYSINFSSLLSRALNGRFLSRRYELGSIGWSFNTWLRSFTLSCKE